MAGTGGRPISTTTDPDFPDNPVFLIDGDALVFRYAVSRQREVDWYEGISTAYMDFRGLVEDLAGYFKTIGASPENTLVMFSGARDLNFRKVVLSTYKFSRTHKKPMGYQGAMGLLAESWCCLSSPCLEADDLLGIFATHPDLTDRAVIVAQDKDLKTVPGWHLDPFAEGPPKFFWISRHKSEAFLYFQALLGDSTDGYKGCPGIGAVKAQALVDKTPDWKHVLGKFQASDKVKNPLSEALTQIRCARILQFTDIDWDKAEIQLWEPGR